MAKSALYKTRGWVLIEPYLKMSDREFRKEASDNQDKLQSTDEKKMPVQAAKLRFMSEILGDVQEMRKELVAAGWTAPS